MAEQNAGEVKVKLVLNVQDLKTQLSDAKTTLKGTVVDIHTKLIVDADSAKNLQRDFDALHKTVDVHANIIWPDDMGPPPGRGGGGGGGGGGGPSWGNPPRQPQGPPGGYAQGPGGLLIPDRQRGTARTPGPAYGPPYAHGPAYGPPYSHEPAYGPQQVPGGSVITPPAQRQRGTVVQPPAPPGGNVIKPPAQRPRASRPPRVTASSQQAVAIRPPQRFTGGPTGANYDFEEGRGYGPESIHMLEQSEQVESESSPAGLVSRRINPPRQGPVIPIQPYQPDKPLRRAQDARVHLRDLPPVRNPASTFIKPLGNLTTEQLDQLVDEERDYGIRGMSDRRRVLPEEDTQQGIKARIEAGQQREQMAAFSNEERDDKIAAAARLKEAEYINPILQKASAGDYTELNLKLPGMSRSLRAASEFYGSYEDATEMMPADRVASDARLLGRRGEGGLFGAAAEGRDEFVHSRPPRINEDYEVDHDKRQATRGAWQPSNLGLDESQLQMRKRLTKAHTGDTRFIDALLASTLGAVGAQAAMDAAVAEGEAAKSAAAEVEANLKRMLGREGQGLTGAELKLAIKEHPDTEWAKGRLADSVAGVDRFLHPKADPKKGKRARGGLMAGNFKFSGGMSPYGAAAAPASSLNDLPGVLANATRITEVGEQGREALVDLKGGGQFVVPNHQLDAFTKMAGKHTGGGIAGRPHEHAGADRWRAPGGAWRDTATAQFSKLHNRGAEEFPTGMRWLGGGTGSNEARRAAANERAVGAGMATPAGAGIQRVAVVNWPAGFASGPGVSGVSGVPGFTPGGVPAAAGRSAPGRGGPPVPPGGPPPGVIASPGPAGPRASTKVTPLTEAEKLEASLTAERRKRSQQQDPGIDPITELRAGISEELSLVPVRALSVAVGQQAQQLFGGRAGILKRARIAAFEVDVADRASKKATGLFEELTEANTQLRGLPTKASQIRLRAGTPEEQQKAADIQQALEDRVADLQQTLPVAEADAAAKLKVAQKAREDIATPAERLRASAVGVAGIVGGTLVFTAAMSAAQKGLEIVGDASSKAADRLLGFEMTTKAVTDAMAQQLAKAQFTPESAYAASIAGSGISAENAAGLSGTLGRVAQLQAGNENLREQINQMRSGLNISNKGGTPGLITATGGLLGSPVFAVPSTVEQFAGAFEEGGFGSGHAAYRGRRGVNDEPIFETVDPGRTEQLKFFQSQLEKGGGGARITSAEGLSEEQRALTANAFAAAGAHVKDAAHLAANIAIKGLTGDVDKDEKMAMRVLASLEKGAERPDAQLLLDIQEPQIRARARGLEMQAALQRDTILPAQFAMGQFADPLSTFGQQGIVPQSNAGFGGFGGTGGSLSAGIARDLEAARTQVLDMAEAGRQPLIDLGLSDQDIAEVEKLGREIRDMQDAAEDMQLAHEATLYNRQLYITKRTLGDIVGLQGKSSIAVDGQVIGSTEMGQLQRAQLEDNRELATIGLARNQRELNMRLALARLESPGETAAERAVRRREAEMLAKEDQRMLDINKRSTTRGFRIEDIGIDRNAEDAVFALQEMQRQRQLTIDIRGIGAVVEAKEQVKNLVVSSKQSLVSVGTTLAEEAINTLVSIQGQANDFSVEFAKHVKTLFKTIRQENAELFHGPPLGGRGDESQAEYEERTYRNKNSDRSEPDVKAASGTMGLTRGTTTFMAGEAGTEGVIVIKNPRVGSLSGGGRGSGTVNINFGNVSVRSDSDIDMLADKVIKRLHQEAATVGAF